MSVNSVLIKDRLSTRFEPGVLTRIIFRGSEVKMGKVERKMPWCFFAGRGLFVRRIKRNLGSAITRRLSIDNNLMIVILGPAVIPPDGAPWVKYFCFVLAAGWKVDSSRPPRRKYATSFSSGETHRAERAARARARTYAHVRARLEARTATGV